jgi:hypothetical protein
MLAPELRLEPLMIPYLELCDAIDRWRARVNGEPVDAPTPAFEAQAPEPAAAPIEDEGMTPQAIAPENTNEIDIDSVDVVEG